MTIASTEPYFKTDYAALLLLLATVAIWSAIETRQQRSRRRTEARMDDRGSRGVLSVCVAVAVLAAAWSMSGGPAGTIADPALTFFVGLGVAWAGIGLRQWASRTLGRYFTFTVMTSADQPVVVAGPYRFIRHPGYAGIELALIGIGLTYDNWIAVASMALFPLAGIIYRVHVEEAALTSRLGDAYRSYVAGRKRLIPFVW